MINESAFPTKRMKLKLKKAEPSRLEVEVLRKQLNDLGLRCQDTSIESLTLYKSQVMQNLPSTKMQACQIAKPKNGFSEAAFRAGELGATDAPYIDDALQLENSATGEWIWDVSAGGYQLELQTIQVPVHFDYLKKNRSTFSGLTAEERVNKQLTSVDAIKGLFIQTAETASSTLGKPLNKDSVEAFYSDAISNLNDSDVKTDYERSDSRILFLTLNYNEEKGEGECDGVGVINVSWNIKIKNYQRKSKNGGDYHDTTIDVFCRGAFYSNPDVLEGDYNAVKSAFKDTRCLMQYPKNPIAVSIFENLPPANRESFLSGLPGAVTDTYTDSIILHSPYWKEHHQVLGFSAKNCTISAAPVSEISYVTDDAHAVPLKLTDTASVSDTLAFKEPVSLKQVVYKAEILRHSLLDGSYRYVESGEYESSRHITI